MTPFLFFLAFLTFLYIALQPSTIRTEQKRMAAILDYLAAEVADVTEPENITR